MHKSDGLQALEKPLASLPLTLRNLILERLQGLTQYEPVIGIMGKTGAGKSSLCNALFAGDVSPVSDVAACTREALRFRLCSGERSMLLVDLPGVGESAQRDSEYEALYRRILPELDLVVWVIKADDRALAVDEQFYHRVMAGYQQRVVFVVNQVDKAEPCHEWLREDNAPSPLQHHTIARKVAELQRLFSPCNPIGVVSARMGWGLAPLVDILMRSLPGRATSPLATQLHPRLCSEPVKTQARDSFGQAVGEVLDTAAAFSWLPAPLKTVVQHVRNVVVSVARAVWNWIFF
ncbi:GTPase family protein [Edwardsiella tarda]|uniref:GTPase family protein n=1 Tax=Edwardsiella tarda TaxID=636 RepID=UPI002852D6FE|nr:GTPase family protein [Edwardsiella tarda]UCQ27266.1 GTPase family protein [Edwardsiella tarda]